MVDLLADDSLPRKKTFEMLNGMHALYGGVLRSLYDHQSSKNIGDAESFELIQFLLDPKIILTEYRVVKDVKKLNLDVAYQSYPLDSKNLKVDKRPALHIMKYFELTDLFTKLFALPNFFNDILGYINSLDDKSEWIYNVVQSPYWKYMKSTLNLKDDEIALPLYIYNDDFEPLNVLGSHRGAYKLSGVYIHMPCLPPEVQSKLQYIFPAMLFFATDRSSYGNARIFTPLIDELNKLQNGIRIVHEKYKLVKIIPILLLGDNLGLNSMMGFVECFVANFYCRICKLHRDEMATADIDDKTKKRTKENYEKDIETNNPSLTGIKERSAWNNMRNFHVVNNLCVDIMHDLFEGVCHVVMSEILYLFIYQHKYFTLDEFNRRIKKHDFGPIDKNTNIALVTPEMIAKRSLNTSAAEMLVLFTNFAFIVGDLVPEDAAAWEVYLLLREIIAIVLQKKIRKNTHHLLRSLVSEHHILFQKVFQKTHTPKLHFMVHYADIMEQLGPICSISSMRYESFHRIFKNIIKSINCRKDIVESCFFKIRMRYASLFLKFKSLTNSHILTGKKTKVLAEDLLKKFNCDLPLKEFVFTTNFVETSSIKLRVGYVVHIKNEDDESPVFAKINEIILTDEKVLFGYQQLSNLGFDNHYIAYKVESGNVFFIMPANFNVKPSYIFQGVGNIQYVIWE